MTAPALTLDDVCVRYGRFVAVDGVTLRVGHGELFGLLGPNGSGKSTTLAAVAGILEPFAGAIAVDGIARRTDPDGYARRIGFVER